MHLGYTRNDFHCLLDGELFLPESWDQDRERCREAGIPDEVVYRPKWRISLELYDRARAAGVLFEWMTADEGYGGKPGFHEGLEERRQQYVLEVPRTFSVWIDPPEVTGRRYRRGGRGRSRQVPRIKAGQTEPRSVENVFWFSSAMKDSSWKTYYVKDSDKGPVVWEAKATRVTPKGSDDLPGHEAWLIVARNVLDPNEMKFFISNARKSTRIETMLLVGFSRWRVERCFQDQKQEIGLDCYEGRRYLGLKRHLILSSVSYLILTRAKQLLLKKRDCEDHDSATAGRYRHHRAELVGA